MIHDDQKKAPIPHASDLVRIGVGTLNYLRENQTETMRIQNVNIPVTIPPKIAQDMKNDPCSPGPEDYSIRAHKTEVMSESGPKEVFVYYGPVVLDEEPIHRNQLDELSQALSIVGMSLGEILHEKTMTRALDQFERAQKIIREMKEGRTR